MLPDESLELYLLDEEIIVNIYEKDEYMCEIYECNSKGMSPIVRIEKQDFTDLYSTGVLFICEECYKKEKTPNAKVEDELIKRTIEKRNW